MCWRSDELVYLHKSLVVLLVLSDIKDETRKGKYRAKAEEYMDRAERIKIHVEREKAAGNYHEQVTIEADSTGHSYGSVFGRFLDAGVKDIEVDDPYVRQPHQV